MLTVCCLVYQNNNTMLRNNKNLIKKSYDTLIPYVPGRDADLLAKDLGLKRVIKLASNENPFGPSPKALVAANKALTKCHRYPDSNAIFLREKLAEKYTIDPSNIIIGSGADSLIHAIAQTFLSIDNEVIISEHAFSSYEIATKANEGNVIIAPSKNYGHDLVAMQNCITEKTKLIFLANPNNPTGTYFSLSHFEKFLKSIPKNILVILDEAYYEYIENDEDSLKLLNTFQNLIILRTFSKAYGLAGFRVGYGFADPSIIELLNRIRSPFTVSVPALAAAVAALDDTEFLEATLEHNKVMRAYFSKALDSMKLNYIGTIGNFLTVNFNSDANMLFQTLLKKGIILRPLKNYKMDNHLRITLGLREDLDTLINELEQML